jgi:hypothetical protein
MVNRQTLESDLDAYKQLPGWYQDALFTNSFRFGSRGGVLAGNLTRASGFSFPTNVNLLS